PGGSDADETGGEDGGAGEDDEAGSPAMFILLDEGAGAASSKADPMSRRAVFRKSRGLSALAISSMRKTGSSHVRVTSLREWPHFCSGSNDCPKQIRRPASVLPDVVLLLWRAGGNSMPRADSADASDSNADAESPLNAIGF
ncbi:unnamed protein product, partial [Darwinula stevensoni]